MATKSSRPLRFSLNSRSSKDIETRSISVPKLRDALKSKNADLPLTRLRDMIWTLTSLQEPRYVPLNYSKDRAHTFKKTRPNIPGQSRQPAVMHVCKESRIVGKRYYSMIRERGQECRRNCPRCLYLTSDYASLKGYKKDSKHTPMMDEERNGFWVNFNRDTFVLSYGTADGAFEEWYLFTREPGPADFTFQQHDLVRIQLLYLSIMPGPFLSPSPSLNWCFAAGTILKELRTVQFRFLENVNRLGERRGSVGRDIWRKENVEEFFRRFFIMWRRLGRPADEVCQVKLYFKWATEKMFWRYEECQ